MNCTNKGQSISLPLPLPLSLSISICFLRAALIANEHMTELVPTRLLPRPSTSDEEDGDDEEGGDGNESEVGTGIGMKSVGLAVRRSVVVLYHPLVQVHRNPSNHVERPERVGNIIELIQQAVEGATAPLKRIKEARVGVLPSASSSATSHADGGAFAGSAGGGGSAGESGAGGGPGGGPGAGPGGSAGQGGMGAAGASEDGGIAADASQDAAMPTIGVRQRRSAAQAAPGRTSGRQRKPTARARGEDPGGHGLAKTKKMTLQRQCPNEACKKVMQPKWLACPYCSCQFVRDSESGDLSVPDPSDYDEDAPFKKGRKRGKAGDGTTRGRGRGRGRGGRGSRGGRGGKSSGGPPAKRPKKEDAIVFLSLVKQRFSKQENAYVFAEVVSCLKKAGSGEMESDVVIDRVTELLDGHPDLIAGFNRFIPQDKPKSPASESPATPPRPAGPPLILSPAQQVAHNSGIQGMHGMQGGMVQQGGMMFPSSGGAMPMQPFWVE